MHFVLRTEIRSLLSLSSEELQFVRKALERASDPSEPPTAMTDNERASARALLVALDTPTHTSRQTLEIVDVWAEPGASVMVRAIEVHGDPVELSTAEALDLAARLRAAIDASE